MPRAGAGGPLAPDDPLRLAGTYQLIAINGPAPPRDVGLLDRFPPFGSCDLTLDGATLVLTGGNAGAGGSTLDVQGRRTNCTDGSGKPFTGASLNGGEAGP